MSRRRARSKTPKPTPTGKHVIDRRAFIETTGSIFVAVSGLGTACTDKLPPLASIQAVVPDPTKCTVTVSSNSITVGATSTLTLQAKDSSGANLTTGGATVVFSASGGTATGTISPTTDNGDGTYTATYTATAAGTAQTIGAAINGSTVTTTMPTITVTVAVQVPDRTKCTVTASPTSIAVAGTSTLTLQAKTSAGANITVGGATVVFTASGGTATGTISATTDNGNGTYTAVYTGTAAGTAQTIGATINSQAVTTTMPTITVTAAAQVPDPTKCTVTASPTTIGIAGTSTLTLQAKTSAGANITVGGATVAFTASGGTSQGTISATTDNGNGTYTAVYTGTTAGTAQTIGATINSQTVTTTMPTITVTAAFATPDIVNNASFEAGDSPSQWDGFTDWGSATPSVGAPRTIGFDGTKAAPGAGSSSVKFYLPTTSGGDLGGQFGHKFSGMDRLFGRFYFFFDTGMNGILKFNIFEDNGFNAQYGGLYIFNGSPLGDLCWWFVDWSGSSGNFVLANLNTLKGAWHSIEYDYWRNGHASGYPAVRLWLDNTQITSGTFPTGFGGTASWDANGFAVAGKRLNGPAPYPSATDQIFTSYYAGVLNGVPNNTQASNLWIDRVALSTLGRVGP